MVINANVGQQNHRKRAAVGHSLPLLIVHARSPRATKVIRLSADLSGRPVARNASIGEQHVRAFRQGKAACRTADDAKCSACADVTSPLTHSPDNAAHAGAAVAFAQRSNETVSATSVDVASQIKSHVLASQRAPRHWSPDRVATDRVRQVSDGPRRPPWSPGNKPLVDQPK